jgi:hypothetical protein
MIMWSKQSAELNLYEGGDRFFCFDHRLFLLACTYTSSIFIKIVGYGDVVIHEMVE